MGFTFISGKDRNILEGLGLEMVAWFDIERGATTRRRSTTTITTIPKRREMRMRSVVNERRSVVNERRQKPQRLLLRLRLVR